jgi:hypothetical protein
MARVDNLIQRFNNRYNGGTMTRRDTMTTKAERRTAAAQRSAPQLRTINAMDVAVLRRLDVIRRDHGARAAWVHTAAVGGTGHSQHANVLTKLERHGLVERKRFAVPRGRVLKSRITTRGQRVLAAIAAIE